MCLLQAPKGMMTSGMFALVLMCQGLSKWTFVVNGLWNRVSAVHSVMLQGP